MFWSSVQFLPNLWVEKSRIPSVKICMTDDCNMSQNMNSEPLRLYCSGVCYNSCKLAQKYSLKYEKNDFSMQLINSEASQQCLYLHF